MTTEGVGSWGGRAIGVLLLVAAAPLAAPAQGSFARERERIAEALHAGQWDRATSRCEATARKIFRDLVARPVDARALSAAFYAELSARCAVAAAAAGDAAAASWLGHGARLLDAGVADAVADESAGIATLPRPRSLHRMGAAEPGRGARPAERMPRQELPPELARFGDGCRLAVEIVVDADGRPREPVAVLQADCAPTQVYFWLREVASWKFRPAIAGGQPVDSLVTLETAFRDLPPRLHVLEGDGG